MSASAIATPLAARAGFAPASSRDVVGAGEKLRGPSVSGSARVATRPPGARLHRARRRGTVAAEAYGESDQRGNWWKPQSGQPRVSRPVDPRPRTSPPSRVGARSSTIPNIERAGGPSRASRNQRTNSRRRLLTRRPRVETQRFSGTKRLRTQRRFRLHPQLLLEVRALSPSRPSSRVARLRDSRACSPREISRLTLPTDLPTHADVISR